MAASTLRTDIHPGPLSTALQAARDRLSALRFADTLWSRSLPMWTTDPAAQQVIANRLGWLDASAAVTPLLPRLEAFGASLRPAGFTDVLLLGMGGSSLAPEVLRQVIGPAAGAPRFRMLDSVDPDAVRRAMEPAATTLFIYASKSGGTIEPRVMAAEARRRVEAAGIADWGSRFVAITDPDTELHAFATTNRFRDLFVNPPDIGGRYSALSLFGMVPAAAMGLDLHTLLDRAAAMATACRSGDPAENPGLALGAFMATGARAGRDKLTVLLPPALASFGLWIEQLVAESTGKHGTGVIPITGEVMDASAAADRIFVSVRMGDEGTDAGLLTRVRASGAPLAELHMEDARSLGAEFFRWEVATAAAGRLLDINPFDEPNVQQAKAATRTILDTYVRTGSLPDAAPQTVTGGVRLALTAAAADGLAGAPATTFLDLARPGDYVALLVYLPPDDTAASKTIEFARLGIGRRSGCATMTGFGPRYLHSTGQLHKGGPASGLFVVITAAGADDLPVPDEPFSFEVLELAQARGDFESLDQAGRRALHIHLPDRQTSTIERALELLIA